MIPAAAGSQHAVPTHNVQNASDDTGLPQI